MQHVRCSPGLFYLTLGLLLLALALGASACSAMPGSATPTPDGTLLEDLPPVVNATGKVMPARWSRLSVSVPGTVQEVLVEKGDVVQAGQVLLRLKGKEDQQAAIAEAQFELSASQKALDDLHKNANDTRTSALESIAAATKAVRDAQYQLDNFTVPQPQSKLSTTEGLEVMKKKLDEARAAFEPYKYYDSGNQTRKDLKEDLDDAQADYNSAVKRLQYETELAAAQARLDEALKDFASWKDGPDPAEVAVAQARLDNANAALAAARASLLDLELQAPFSGTISEVDVRVGEWIIPGQPPVIQLAELEHLRVETTDLNEIDAARVKVNAAVVVTFDALPGVTIQGTVKSISPKATEGSGVNYTAVIELDEQPAALRWGMTAFVDIAVEE